MTLRKLCMQLLSFAVPFFPLNCQNDQGKTEICQGEYTLLSSTTPNISRDLKLETWKFYGLADGTHVMQSSLAFGTQERHILTRDFQSTGISVVLLPPDRAGFRLWCDFKSSGISCVEKSDDKSESFEIRHALPYAFAQHGIGAAPFYDVASFYRTLVLQAPRSAGSHTEIPVISIEGDTDATDSKLKISATIQIEYLGLDKLEILNKRVKAHKYRIVALGQPQQPKQELWTTSDGLILKATAGIGAALALTSYQGPPLQ